MSTKFLVVGTVVGGILLFVWGGITHAVLPQVIPAYQVFKDDAALGAFSLTKLPYWNWYGFSPLYMSLEALDLVGKFFIAGLVLGALMNKLARTPA